MQSGKHLTEQRCSHRDAGFPIPVGHPQPEEALVPRGLLPKPPCGLLLQSQGKWGEEPSRPCSRGWRVLGKSWIIPETTFREGDEKTL